MKDFLSGTAAVLVTIPLAGYLLVFVLCKQITRNHRKSVKLAIDACTFLLILAVHFLIMTIWGKSYLWMIVLTLLVIGFLFVLMNWKYRQEVEFRRIFKGFWRFNFLLFLFAYIFLILFGLFQRIAWLAA
ncbi:DUF3397 domain-containing protein [Mesobacillus zeae]|uniref:DUF3397 domain-containing protein n=1 Tax=Mesobacillus zeae TaxID=1917180 RepID=A0A398BJI9_9BACI|nr:DUF3397 domain-containing protein [Mesobacillus zeae]RID87900.1 DUF3397 domain-containing protein [Mesobacillus zeae]